MSDETAPLSAVRVEPVVSHLSTPEEIARFAIEGNHAILYQCVQMHRHGKYTWGQAMQVAAFMQAESLAILNKQLYDCISRVPCSGMVANAALTGERTEEK